MINKDIKRANHRRWMRCINADNLEDYVDIAIGGGSRQEERQAVLEIVDFIGGDWRGSVLQKGIRVKYDYYYLYYRDKDGVYDETGNGEYSGGVAIGCHNNGDIVKVDINTHEIIDRKSLSEWTAWSKDLNRAAE